MAESQRTVDNRNELETQELLSIKIGEMDPQRNQNESKEI